MYLSYNDNGKDRHIVKSIAGTDVKVTYEKLEPGSVTDHSDPMEHMGRVISGEVELVVNDASKVYHSGETYRIPVNSRCFFKVVSEVPAEIMDIIS
ncbi:MAG: cupin domain-containing protein [Candidatus Omnitrophica bacterium]|nr:cupin domain-containing protein [Candidatus Omnitrophota bacterium]